MALDIDSADWRFYYGRGISYDALDDFSAAIADYDEAIAYGCDEAQVYLYRGNAYAEIGDHDRAIANYGHAIRRRPITWHRLLVEATFIVSWTNLIWRLLTMTVPSNWILNQVYHITTDQYASIGLETILKVAGMKFGRGLWDSMLMLIDRENGRDGFPVG